MPKTLEGACPGCGQPLYIELAVLAAPRGFADNPAIPLQERAPMFIGDGHAETGQGGTPSAVHSGDGRPVCPACGLDGARLEQTAKKNGRPFTAWKCINTECDQNDEIIQGTFRWGKAAAA